MNDNNGKWDWRNKSISPEYIYETEGGSDYSLTEDQYLTQTLRRKRAERTANRQLDEEERSSTGEVSLFEPIDLVSVEDPPPLACGEEGIFPLGSVSLLVGTHNIGKSPVMAFTGLQRIRAGWDSGECFGVYDLEMGPARYRRMLQELGADDDEIARFRYYGDISNPRNLVINGRALCERARLDGCRTLVFDSLVAMLSVSGVNENDSVAVRGWFDAAARPMTLWGGSAIVADHSGLNDVERGRGTSDKARAVDFAVHMKVTGESTVGKRRKSGSYELKCTKDRDARLIGDSMNLGHDAFQNGTFSYSPDGWSDSSDEPETQAKIRGVLEHFARPVSIREISKEISMDYEAVRSAIRRGATGSDPVFSLVRGIVDLTNRSGKRGRPVPRPTDWGKTGRSGRSPEGSDRRPVPGENIKTA